ncbi:exosortase B [Pseudomonadota bacterium]
MKTVTDKYAMELRALSENWLVVVGLLVVFAPTLASLANGPWQQSEYAHGPIVLAAILWLFWQKREVIFSNVSKSSPFIGGAFLILGSLLYALGRSQTIFFIEVGSAIPIVLGIIILTKGFGPALRCWFPLVFLLFLIPLPSFLIDALTGPLKNYVSIAVSNLLYELGYPVARNGVVITIGQYQLLIADACSGLNSMYALTSLGILFVYLKRKISSTAHIVLMLIAIIPIAFITNVARVTTLSLLTYYFGDEVGLGFSHDTAAVVEFFIALFLLTTLDSALFRLLSKKRQQGKNIA